VQRFTTDAQLDNWFAYHRPTGDTIAAHERVRVEFRALAATLQELIPECPGKTVAFRAVREAMFAANAAIACNQPEAP
jgi:hypothetical protein